MRASPGVVGLVYGDDEELVLGGAGQSHDSRFVAGDCGATIEVEDWGRAKVAEARAKAKKVRMLQMGRWSIKRLLN